MYNTDYSIICCLYNEKQIIEKKFNDFLKQAKSSPFTYEILVCDNHSNDGTSEFLKKIEPKNAENVKFIFIV